MHTAKNPDNVITSAKGSGVSTFCLSIPKHDVCQNIKNFNISFERSKGNILLG